jgi:phospholipid:diacylglycerol acyltransferase
MAALIRRRPIHGSSDEHAGITQSMGLGPQKHSTNQDIDQLSQSQTRKRRNTFIFLLGSLCGILLAGIFAEHNNLIEFPEIRELTMDSLFDVLPSGLMRDLRDFAVGSCDPSLDLAPYVLVVVSDGYIFEV